MNVSDSPCDSCRSYRELRRGVVCYRCNSTVVCRDGSAKGYACGIALTCICRYIKYICRTGDGRNRIVNNCYVKHAGRYVYTVRKGINYRSDSYRE